MASSTTLSPIAPPDLGTALIQGARTPLLVLDSERHVAAASRSFCRSFDFVPADIVGKDLFALGDGTWDLAPLRDLISSTIAGEHGDDVAIDLVRPGHLPCRLMAHVRRLDVSPPLRLMLQFTDITASCAAKHQLDALVREKAVLHHDVQHRLANSLQIIASILTQSARRAASDDSRAPLVDANRRVIAVAALQRQLSPGGRQDVAIRPFLRDLCASMSAALIYDPKRLSLGAVGDDSVIDAERSLGLGLIVTELTINAIRHAFPGDDPAGTIVVDYRAGGDAWELSVTDDGIGMPPASVVRYGLGSSLVGVLADKLRARVVVAPANPGTRVTVTHP